MPSPLDPATFAQAIILESADIPADMTIAQWRERRRLDQAPRASRRTRRRSRSSGLTATARRTIVPSGVRLGMSSKRGMPKG